MIAVLSWLTFLASILPWLPLAHGFVRSFDFCRLQVLAMAACLLLASGVASWPSLAQMLACAVPAATALLIQAFHVLPFTPVWHAQTKRFVGGPGSSGSLSVLSCNVKQSNRDFESVGRILRNKAPDIAVFMEVDSAWCRALRADLSDYPNVVTQPQENSYGILLASRLPLRSQKIRFLLNKEVPSIDVEIGLPGGQTVRLIALHPEPPVPTRDTEARDAEILLVGKMARQETNPTIVTGDLNDVAWSRTTCRFLRISRLLDPRQGRGLFNSFDAGRWYLRWPLDHIFLSRHFELMEIARLDFVGSDHFPMFYRLVLTSTHRNNLPDKATSKDKQEANQAVSAEMARDRKPVGEDWE